MEQSPSWEANWFAASHEIPRVLWNPKVPHLIHKRTPRIPILSQPNPVLNRIVFDSELLRSDAASVGKWFATLRRKLSSSCALKLWRSGRHFPSKRRVSLTQPLGITSQEPVILDCTALPTTKPTNLLVFLSLECTCLYSSSYNN
jgi:hypothetical protein